MNFDEIVVKESPGLCRCCLSEGCYKDLSTEYTWMNETEVYADMLLECFDISISQHNGGPNGGNRLICEVCITRLRDACNFKKQVLDSEKKFVDLLARGEFQPKVIMYQATMKAEELLEESIVEDAEVEYLDEGMDYEDDLPLKQPEAVTEASVSDVTVESLKVKGKRGRPRKTTSVVKTDKRKVPKIEEKPRTSKTMTKGDTDFGEETDDEFSQEDQIQRVRLETMKESALRVILNSTVMPFRWLTQAYRCFFCYEIFENSKELKVHTEFHIDECDIRDAMSKYLEKCIYIDVSQLFCKICPEDQEIPDLNSLLLHLTDNHGLIFDDNISKFMYAFKLNDSNVECVNCGIVLKSFGRLLSHFIKEHDSIPSEVLCDCCGLYLKNRRDLILHIRREHDRKPVKCSKCDVIITNKSHQRVHMQRYHNKTYRCLKCPEVFGTHYKRSQHMMAVHKGGMITCQYCPKTFVFRSMMDKHVREAHLHEKNFECLVCGFQAFQANRLRNHLAKHSNERNVQCTVCDKTFKTRKTMMNHFSNLHKNDTSRVINLPEVVAEMRVVQDSLETMAPIPADTS